MSPTILDTMHLVCSSLVNVGVLECFDSLHLDRSKGYEKTCFFLDLDLHPFGMMQNP